MNSLLRKIAGKGYGWYLALKICKAALAIPLFAGHVVLCLGVVVLLAAWHAGKAAFWDFPRMMMGEVSSYWDRPWFRYFGRAHYNALYRPTPQEVPDA